MAFLKSSSSLPHVHDLPRIAVAFAEMPVVEGKHGKPAGGEPLPEIRQHPVHGADSFARTTQGNGPDLSAMRAIRKSILRKEGNFLV